MIVFSTRAYGYLADEVARLGGFTVGEVERKSFPDGERYQRILSAIDGRDVALIGGTTSDADTLELYDLASALVTYGVHCLTLVIPYFGYSTMERAVKPGEVVTAKTRARLLSSIPVAGSGSRVVLIDLHTEGVAHYFEGFLRPVHLYAKPIVVEAARRLAAEGGGSADDFVLACTDAGRAKWVESLANDLGVSASFVFKRRLDGQLTQVTAVSAQVRGRTVIIYDDMIRTGGSLLNAAHAYRDAGARRIAAICTHGLFPGDALERLEKSGLFFGIVATNSHPRAVALASQGRADGHGRLLAVESVGPLLASHLTAEQTRRKTI